MTTWTQLEYLVIISFSDITSWWGLEHLRPKRHTSSFNRIQTNKAVFLFWNGTPKFTFRNLDFERCGPWKGTQLQYSLWPFLYPKPNSTLSPKKYVYTADLQKQIHFERNLMLIQIQIFSNIHLWQLRRDWIFYGYVCTTQRSWFRIRQSLTIQSNCSYEI